MLGGDIHVETEVWGGSMVYGSVGGWMNIVIRKIVPGEDISLSEFTKLSMQFKTC